MFLFFSKAGLAMQDYIATSFAWNSSKPCQEFLHKKTMKKRYNNFVDKLELARNADFVKEKILKVIRA